VDELDYIFYHVPFLLHIVTVYIRHYQKVNQKEMA